MMTDTWYYSTDGTKQGPVDAETLWRMRWAGQLQPQHMIWKAGMADWAQVGRMPELFAQPQRAAPIPLAPAAPLGRLVPETAPTGLTTYGDEYSQGLIWRDGKILVMRKGASLPFRCVRTNEPAEKLVKRKLVWYSPLWLLLLLIGLLPCLIVILCVQKKATIMIGLSKETIRRRRIKAAVGLLGVLACTALVVAGVAAESGWIALSGAMVFLVAVIYAGVGNRRVSPSRIDDYYVHLKGCCPAYLDAFPPLPAPGTGLL